jgi:hypothetical protein
MSDSVSQSATIRKLMLIRHEQNNDHHERDWTNYLPLIHAMRESA